ncbi:hypothetical protein B0H21DRAFT_832802 [Amylocystis lapponica]|nr:hypothetical protein B0H21DRAFT_832802 [Amylocystis lapponica]
MYSWSHPPQLQLEQEYDIDPAQFHALQGDTGQHYDRRPPPSSDYSSYLQAYGETAQNAFPFSAPHSQNPNASYESNVLYTGSDTRQAQRPTQHFQPPNNIYGGRSGLTQQPQVNQAMYHTDPTPYPYASHSRQGSGVGTSQRPNMGSTPAVQSFQPLEVNTGMGAAQSAYASSAMPMPPAYSSPPEFGADLQGHQFHHSPYPPATPSGDQSFVSHGAKRPRVADDNFIDGEGDVEGEGQVEGLQGRGDPSKRSGACARCKGLKVRCEFNDPDICKRCANGGHECIIPGRKKRRPPPKREFLLNQIREQATQIEALITQLDEARKADRRRSAGHTSSSSAADRRPSLSLSPSELTTPDIAIIKAEGDSGTAPDVEDWIAKARQTMEAFGGYINMGGSSVTMEMLGDEGESDDGSEGVLEDDGDVDGGDGESGEMSESVLSLDSPANGRGRGYFSRESTDSASDSTHRRGHGGATQKLATLPHEAAPFGLMATLALNKSRRQRSRRSSISEASAGDHGGVGLANDDYFRPSPAPEKPMTPEHHQPPHVLRTGLLKPHEVEKLFTIYFDYMNLSCSLLDPVLYTAQKTYWRSPFLFTVICAVASRHYNLRPELYPQAMKYARLAAGTALIGGQKSVEIVEAYILLTLYPAPARRWEEDRSWIYLGLAIRLAIDLNLHYPNTPHPNDEQHAREMLNRTRVWLNCFNLDRSTGSQYGKSSIIPNSDYVANHTEDWWKSSPWNIHGFDIHICCYNAELKVMADFKSRIYSNPNHPTGLNQDANVSGIASETDDHLAELWGIWDARIREQNFKDRQALFRTGLLKLAFSYARLTVLSVGFQHSFSKTGTNDEVPFMKRCLRAAMDVVTAVVDDIGIPEQRVYLRHGAEAQSVFVTFASAFLVKLLQPKYHLPRDQRADIRQSVQRVIDLLGSPEVAIDERHGPMLYARFLQGLLASPMARLDHSPASTKRNTGSPRNVKPKRSVSSKSPPPASELENALGTGSARQSLSPPISDASPLTPPQVSVDPYAQSQAGMAAYAPQQQMVTDFTTPPYLAAPLPFDSELLQTMHSLTDLNTWPNMMVLPGFNWMVPDNDSNMRMDQTIGMGPG